MSSKIKNKRLEIGVMQYKVAEMLGVSARTYSRWEKEGRVPKKEKRIQLEKILGAMSTK